jgi:uncharacterized protein (TIGR02271 family)
MTSRADKTTVHEEQIAGIDSTWRRADYLKARKLVDQVRVEELVPRDVEELFHETSPPGDVDSGKIETLPDGSISIPIYEEQVIVTKRIVLKERVIIRKHTLTEHEQVTVDLRKERVAFDADPGVEVVEQ